MKPFSTYPEGRAKLLDLAARVLDDDGLHAASIELADLVRAILTDEAIVIASLPSPIPEGRSHG